MGRLHCQVNFIFLIEWRAEKLKSVCSVYVPGSPATLAPCDLLAMLARECNIFFFVAVSHAIVKNMTLSKLLVEVSAFIILER